MREVIEKLEETLSVGVLKDDPTLETVGSECEAWYADLSLGEAVGWEPEMGILLVAWLVETFGDDILDEGKILTPSSVRAAGGKVGMFFLPPQTIGKAKEGTFPDAEKLWWEAVADALKSGKAFDLTDPKELKPLYGKIMSAWKNKIEAKYGFRPTRSKERSMQQDIDKQIKTAAAAMRKSRGKGEVDKEALSRAAKAMRARRTAKAKKATG